MKQANNSTTTGPGSPEEFDPIEAEKRAWLEKVPVQDADDILFQFETSIKALDRFFNIANHPRRRAGQVTIDDDMQVEIQVADRRMRGLLQLCQNVLNETDTSAFVFRSYVETQLVSDLERDALLAKHQTQSTPQESLYLLQVGLRSLVQLSAGLLAADHVSLSPFRALGHQYAALVIQNRYFNPLRRRGFSPMYDRVEHPMLQHAVRQADSEQLRRGLSFLILMLNRYQRIINWLRPGAATRQELYDALPFLALLRSDFRTLIPYLEQGFAERVFPDGPQSQAEAAFLEQVDALAFQLAMETRKVFEQLLLDFSQINRVGALRSGLEAAHGLMNSFLQQSIVNLVQCVLPDTQGKDIFTDFVSRFEQSKRLREDIWVFHESVHRVVVSLKDPERDPADKRADYDALLAFLTYFLDLTFNLVRAADHETFANFISSVQALERESFEHESRNEEIARTFEHFRIFLETTLGHIEKRVDLQGVALDRERAERLLDRFVAET